MLAGRVVVLSGGSTLAHRCTYSERCHVVDDLLSQLVIFSVQRNLDLLSACTHHLKLLCTLLRVVLNQIFGFFECCFCFFLFFLKFLFNVRLLFFMFTMLLGQEFIAVKVLRLSHLLARALMRWVHFLEAIRRSTRAAMLKHP